jgi:DNA-binding winged helix-turn-helix (wHTH) protein
MTICRPRKLDRGKDIGMRTSIASRNKSRWTTPVLDGAKRRRSQPASTHSPKTPRNEVAEFLTNIDGVPVLVRLLVTDAPAKAKSALVSGETDLHSLLSSTVEKVVDRMRGSSPRSDAPSTQPLATAELISSAQYLARVPALSKDTVLRVGPLELDLLDRTAKRGDRRIDLRPREFQLLKYMMQRSDQLLARATLLKEVWNYKFVPETNLIDVHMGRLRRKVDGPNEPPLIRNVRGVGFVLSPTALSQYSPPRSAERADSWPLNEIPPATLTGHSVEPYLLARSMGIQRG